MIHAVNFLIRVILTLTFGTIIIWCGLLLAAILWDIRFINHANDIKDYILWKKQ
jgi:hypothetical protein